MSENDKNVNKIMADHKKLVGGKEVLKFKDKPENHKE